MYLHVTRLFVPEDILLKYVLTPAFDAALAIPMTYAAITSWIVWKRVAHPATWHRLLYGFVAVYFTVSIPIHAWTFFTHSVDYVSGFPLTYSLAILPVQFALLMFAQRLRFMDRNA